MSVFEVSDDCLRLGLRAIAVVFRDVTIGPANAGLQADIESEAAQARSRYVDLKALIATPELTRLYEVFRSIGVNPKKHPPSIPNLYRYALKRGCLPSINNFVDAYNLISLRTLFSLGAHDLAALSLPVTMQLFDGSETFIPLGSHEPRPVTAGEFGYVDADNRVICRLDVVQGEFSKVTAASKEVLLIVESTDAMSVERQQQVAGEAIGLIQTCCGGTAERID